MSNFVNPAPWVPSQDSTKVVPQRFSKRLTIIITAAVIVLAIIGTVVGVSVHNAQIAHAQQIAAAKKKAYENAILKRVYDGCADSVDPNAWFPETLELGDENKTLNLSSDADSAMEGYYCVQGRSKMPESVIGKIAQTNSYAGVQSDSWGNLKATWSYNGNSGLNLTLEVIEK